MFDFEAMLEELVRVSESDQVPVDKLDARPGYTQKLRCLRCGVEFLAPKSAVTPAPSRKGGVRKYCSYECYNKARVKPAPKYTCAYCGKERERTKQRFANGRFAGYSYKARFCSHTCGQLANGRGKNQGVGFYDKNGYRILHRDGRTVPEHRYVMERWLGRPLLESETIHHINGVRDDNRLENLELRAGQHGRGQRVEDLLRHWAEGLEQYGVEIDESSLQRAIEMVQTHHNHSNRDN